MNEKVAIVKSSGDAAEPLRSVVQHALDLLDSPLEDIDGGSTVVIKPNITANNISFSGSAHINCIAISKF